jgi:UDP-glucuronate decarboxylase
MANIQHLMGHPRFEFIRHDITLPVHLEVDEIYHLACPASPKAYQYNPIKTIKTGVLGTINVLGLAKRVRAKCLFASTSEVYGDPLVSPQSEDYFGNVNPVGPRSCYDEAKRVGESLCVEYHRSNGVDVRIARIFNTYGPRLAQDDGRVVSNFIVQALQGRELTVYGNGSQTRAFCYVDDTVKGLMLLMASDYTEPVNIGNPEEIKVCELALTILDLVGGPSSLVSKPIPKDDPKQRRPDISLARRVLGWSPSTPLEKGLAKTIEYFKDLL